MSCEDLSENALVRHRRIRAGFVMPGTTLHAWCKSNGVLRQSAEKALCGQWVGRKAEGLAERIGLAAGVGSR